MSALSDTNQGMTQLGEPFEADIVIQTACQDALKAFETWAAIDKGDLPEDAVDAMQIRLMRWQRDRFGLQTDERLALGIIEEVTETDIASDANEAFDGLGDACVYSSQIATNNRLAIRPIIALAHHMVVELIAERAAQREQPGPGSMLPIIIAPGILAQVALKRAQKVRGLDDDSKYRLQLTGALAACIAHCTIGVMTKGVPIEQYRIEDVFLEVGEAVSQRNVGHDAIPKDTVH